MGWDSPSPWLWWLSSHCWLHWNQVFCSVAGLFPELEQRKGGAVGFTPEYSAGWPIQQKETSAPFTYFKCWKLLNIHRFSSCVVSSKGPHSAYLFRCRLTVINGMYQGNWEHVMSNINIFYYVTLYCFGLEMSWWFIVYRDTYMHVLTCFLHSDIFDWNCQ